MTVEPSNLPNLITSSDASPGSQMRTAIRIAAGLDVVQRLLAGVVTAQTYVDGLLINAAHLCTLITDYAVPPRLFNRSDPRLLLTLMPDQTPATHYEWLQLLAGLTVESWLVTFSEQDLRAALEDLNRLFVFLGISADRVEAEYYAYQRDESKWAIHLGLA